MYHTPPENVNSQNAEPAKKSSESKYEAPKATPEDLSAVEDRLRGRKYAGTTFTAEEIISAYRGEIKIKLIARGDCFYDITKIENITDGTDGQALIKAAISADDVSNISIPDSSAKINPSGENSKNLSLDLLSHRVRHACEHGWRDGKGEGRD